MLIGQYDSKISDKGRIQFPKRFRDILGEQLIVTLGYENSLMVVSQESWKTLIEGTENKPFIQSETRATQRFLLGNASFIELDSKGRFILPNYLREYAKLVEDIIFLGLSKYVELWGKENWDSYRGILEKNIDTISQKLTQQKGNE